ncbi:hypothetical protein BX600DRAFT_477856 [Xylariales sp. PMI_506]|nr:hypothetical protein BX600DRAFT_477856 [Xylariales sp. PMI_506]
MDLITSLDKPNAGPPTVIHAAPGRSGTMSMAAAYQILGLRTYHSQFQDNLVNFRQYALLEEAAEAKYPWIPGARPRAPFTKADWDELFGDFDVVTENGANYVEELLAAYPGAKVVVTERDFDSWWRSYEKQCVGKLWDMPGVEIVAYLMALLTGYRGFQAMQKQLLGVFGAHNADEIRRNAKGYHKAYYEHVRRIVPPEQRLEYKLGDGWAPLCEFLGKEIPDVDFPRINEGGQHDARMAALMNKLSAMAWQTLRPWVVGFSATGAVALGIYLSGVVSV